MRPLLFVAIFVPCGQNYEWQSGHATPFLWRMKRRWKKAVASKKRPSTKAFCLTDVPLDNLFDAICNSIQELQSSTYQMHFWCRGKFFSWKMHPFPSPHNSFFDGQNIGFYWRPPYLERVTKLYIGCVVQQWLTPAFTSSAAFVAFFSREKQGIKEKWLTTLFHARPHGEQWKSI